MRNKNIVAIIQARMGSTRLPGKVMMNICGEPALFWCVERVRMSQYIDEVVVATTINKKDKVIQQFCFEQDIKYFLGSEEDVLGRVYNTARYYKADYIVDITADCPFIDPKLIDNIIKNTCKKNFIYGSNIDPRTFPDGLDVQVYSFSALERINKLEKDPIKRHHVGWNILNRFYELAKPYEKMYSLTLFKNESYTKFSELECTLDTKKDLELLNDMANQFYNDGLSYTFSYKDIIRYLVTHPQKKQKRNIPGEG